MGVHRIGLIRRSDDGRQGVDIMRGMKNGEGRIGGILTEYLQARLAA